MLHLYALTLTLDESER